MPKHRKPGKKPIEQYDHEEASRANNPPVGLVTPETDRDAGKKTYTYDPHIDPSRHNRCDAQEEWQWNADVAFFELHQRELAAALDYVFLTGCFGIIKYHL